MGGVEVIYGNRCRGLKEWGWARRTKIACNGQHKYRGVGGEGLSVGRSEDPG